jgi:hypothetical protein
MRNRINLERPRALSFGRSSQRYGLRSCGGSFDSIGTRYPSVVAARHPRCRPPVTQPFRNENSGSCNTKSKIGTGARVRLIGSVQHIFGNPKSTSTNYLNKFRDFRSFFADDFGMGNLARRTSNAHFHANVPHLPRFGGISRVTTDIARVNSRGAPRARPISAEWRRKYSFFSVRKRRGAWTATAVRRALARTAP